MTGIEKNKSMPVQSIPAEVLLEGYAQGVFPMARSRNDPGYQWYTTERRGVIPIDQFHVSRKVRRLIRNTSYRWAVNENFRAVMEGCADRETTWISDRIIESFVQLHELGHAHSVEIYKDERLVGGVYGVTLRSAFFAESVFRRDPEMDKVALYHCHQRLKKRKFRLWDVQFYTPHLDQFGCIEISASDYDRMLNKALRYHAQFDNEKTNI